MSHPTRVRGLKPAPADEVHGGLLVAPHAGAWIETDERKPTLDEFKWSHPTRVRGLKQTAGTALGVDAVSHPTRVRGLKHHRGRSAL